jgi:CBS domain-containing protein
MGTAADSQGSLAAISAALRSGEAPPVVTVRSFLGWFGAQRRGYYIAKQIRGALRKAGLRTEPDFESAYIDAELSFSLAAKASASDPITPVPEIPETLTLSNHVEVRLTSVAFADPTHRMSKLAAANRPPMSIKPDALIGEAVTLMMMNEFSQLPVMPNERDVKGMVSWRTIGSRLALGQNPKTVGEVMDPPAEISADASLFAAIPLIVEHQYVLVRSTERRIVGIVTTSDLSLQFLQLAEPFLLLGEIENHVRRIIGSHFDPAELAAAHDPGVTDGRLVESAADLSFGEYRRLLEEPKRWDRLQLQVDRAVFVRQLDRVREIRNDVMHFDPDNIPPSDVEALRDFARFLRTLQTIGAT